LSSVAPFSLQDILRERKVTVAFQPVLSIKKQSLIGVEALFRGEAGPGSVSHGDLREQAVAEGMTLELDRLLREMALTNFKSLDLPPETLLFLNFDPGIIDQGVVGSGRILKTVQDLAINPHTVVIEIMASHVYDIGSLEKFVAMYRESGFLIALKGVGSGHSNLMRILQAKPDILKIDGSLAAQLAKDFYRQEILRSLVNLSRNLGALSAVQGVANDDDAVTALDLGADMLQGDFVPDIPENRTGWTETLQAKLTALGAKHKEDSVKKTKENRARQWENEKIFNALLQDLTKAEPKDFDKVMGRLAGEQPAVECLYVLDQAGVQISDTVSVSGALKQQRKLFSPAVKGADHSSKEYYYLLMDTFTNKYISAPYTSLASGHLCVTISGAFTNAAGGKFVLCVDFPVDN